VGTTVTSGPRLRERPLGIKAPRTVSRAGSPAGLAASEAADESLSGDGVSACFPRDHYLCRLSLAQEPDTFERVGWFVVVVFDEQSYLASVHAAFGVHVLEVPVGAVVQGGVHGRGGLAEGKVGTEQDFRVAYALRSEGKRV